MTMVMRKRSNAGDCYREHTVFHITWTFISILTIPSIVCPFYKLRNSSLQNWMTCLRSNSAKWLAKDFSSHQSGSTVPRHQETELLRILRTLRLKKGSSQGIFESEKLGVGHLWAQEIFISSPLLPKPYFVRSFPLPGISNVTFHGRWQWEHLYLIWWGN
jgi:hypothetical protein